MANMSPAPKIDLTLLRDRDMYITLQGYGPGWPNVLQVGYEEKIRWYFYTKDDPKAETTASRVTRIITLNQSDCWEVSITSDLSPERQQLEYFAWDEEGIYWVLSIVQPEAGKPLEVTDRGEEPPAPLGISKIQSRPEAAIECFNLKLNGQEILSLCLRLFPEAGETPENDFISEEYYDRDGFCRLFRRYLPENWEKAEQIQGNASLDWKGKKYFLYYDGVLIEKKVPLPTEIEEGPGGGPPAESGDELPRKR
jgi:hypothetical protein